MKVIRAEAMGFCFGVRDALALTEQIDNPAAVTVHGELVHNEAVVARLQERGFRVTPEQEQRPLPGTREVMVTAHGISEAERKRLESAGKRIVDTTCPLVRRVHQAARQLSDEGFHVLLIGRRGHVEVRGIVEDLASCEVVQGEDEVGRYSRERLGVICQSTTPPRQAASIVETIRKRNPHAEVRFVDTICQPTKDRQQAARRLADQVDAVVVVGGRNSNNTRALVELCGARVPAFHVENAAQIDPRWFAGCETVGLTAGTSTLDATIDAVHERLAQL